MPVTEQTIEAFVWAVFFAILAAIVYTFLVQTVLSRLVKRLSNAGADTPEIAKTLKQLGYRNAALMALVRVLANGGSPLARALVKYAPQEKTDPADKELLFAEKPEVSYFLPAENRTKSFEKHYAERVPLVKMAGLIVLLTAAAFAASGVVRFLGNWAGDLISSDSKKEPYGTTERDDSLLNEQEQLNREEQERLAQEEKNAENAENPENAGNGQDGSGSAESEDPTDVTDSEITENGKSETLENGSDSNT